MPPPPEKLTRWSAPHISAAAVVLCRREFWAAFEVIGDST
jgi:hypothetical protein